MDKRVCGDVSSFSGFTFFSKGPRKVVSQNPDPFALSLELLATDEGPIEAEWLPGNTQEGTGEADCIQKRGDALSICLRSTSWEASPGSEAETSAEHWPGREPQNESALFWQLPIFEEERTNAGQRKGPNWMF